MGMLHNLEADLPLPDKRVSSNFKMITFPIESLTFRSLYDDPDHQYLHKV